MKEEKTFMIDDQEMTYVIIYKKIKKVYLKIEEGQIHIHCPYETPLTLIEDFILENYPKIKLYLENYRPLACYQDGGYVYLLKKKYYIKVIDMNIKKVVLKGDTLVFYHHQVEKGLEPYLKAWLKDYLETKVAMYCKQEKRFGEPIIELKKTKRRYGACYYRQNRVVFNPILIHFSTDFIVNNSRVKQWVKLKKKKYRDEYQEYLVEGDHLVEEALKASQVKTILSLDTLNIAGVECIQVTQEIIDKLTQVDTPQPIMAICKKKAKEQINLSGKKFLLLDQLQDPGNIGTLVRTAYAFNFDQVIFSEGSVDLYNDKFIRASQGACFHIDCIKKDLKEVVETLKQQGISIYGTSLENGQDIQTIEPTLPVALILGNEGNGVSKELLDSTTKNIYIPISGAESLNVAVAGGICMFYFNK